MVSTSYATSPSGDWAKNLGSGLFVFLGLMWFAASRMVSQTNGSWLFFIFTAMSLIAAVAFQIRKYVEIDTAKQWVTVIYSLFGMRLDSKNRRFDEFGSIAIYRRPIEIRGGKNATRVGWNGTSETVYVSLRLKSGELIPASAFESPIDWPCAEADKLAAEVHASTGLPIEAIK